MNYLICTFADADKKDKNYLTTYQVRKVVDEKDYKDAMLVGIAENTPGSCNRAFVFTDEKQPRRLTFTYIWKGYRYVDIEDGQQINLNVLKIIK